MSYFSETLKDLMDHRKWSAVELCDLSKVQQPHISRYRKGRTTPKLENLIQLIGPFSLAEQLTLAIAWLKDMRPPTLSAHIDITPSGALPSSATLAEPIATYAAKPQRPDGISDTLWAQVCRCAELARDVPEVAAIFAEFDRLIQRRAIQP